MSLFPYRFRIHRKNGTFSGLAITQRSSDRRNPLPFLSGGQACPGLAGHMPLQGLRRPDHVYSPKVWIWPALLRPTPDPEVEIPFYLPQLPDDTGPAGMGRNDNPDVPSVEVELPFSASVRQTLTSNPRSHHVTCNPTWLDDLLRKVSCPFQAPSTEDL
jgi:hypothetical protein